MRGVGDLDDTEVSWNTRLCAGLYFPGASGHRDFVSSPRRCRFSLCSKPLLLNAWGSGTYGEGEGCFFSLGRGSRMGERLPEESGLLSRSDMKSRPAGLLLFDDMVLVVVTRSEGSTSLRCHPKRANGAGTALLQGHGKPTTLLPAGQGRQCAQEPGENASRIQNRLLDPPRALSSSKRELVLAAPKACSPPLSHS